MPYYIDTSAFVKLIVHERHSVALSEWVERTGPELVASDLLRIEALRSARQHSPQAVVRVRIGLESITLLAVDVQCCELASQLDPRVMRSLDALHLASALTLGDSLEGVITYDDRMAEACSLLGLAVIAPTDGAAT